MSWSRTDQPARPAGSGPGTGNRPGNRRGPPGKPARQGGRTGQTSRDRPDRQDRQGRQGQPGRPGPWAHIRGRHAAAGTSDRRRPPRHRPRPWTRPATTAPSSPPRSPARELDRNVTAQLKGLPRSSPPASPATSSPPALLIDDDPETAYQHTLAARARAARLAVVREACGEAAYAAGEYAEALAELRAAKRMNGSTAYLPVMADCERALGRPERALALAKSPAVANFDPPPKPR